MKAVSATILGGFDTFIPAWYGKERPLACWFDTLVFFILSWNLMITFNQICLMCNTKVPAQVPPFVLSASIFAIFLHRCMKHKLFLIWWIVLWDSICRSWYFRDIVGRDCELCLQSLYHFSFEKWFLCSGGAWDEGFISTPVFQGSDGFVC